MVYKLSKCHKPLQYDKASTEINQQNGTITFNLNLF